MVVPIRIYIKKPGTMKPKLNITYDPNGNDKTGDKF